MSPLRNSRFWLFLIIPVGVFGLVAYFTTAVQILPVLSLLVFAGATGVCVAWIPGLVGFFRRSGAPSTGEVLALGIWLSWAVVAFFGAWSFLWRVAGQPLWMANNDAVAFVRYTSFLSSLLHMVSPHAIEDRIPNARWLWIGAGAAGALAIFCLVSYHLGLYKDIPAVMNSRSE